MAINNISGILSSLITSELNKTQKQLLESFERISTGQKLNSASDNPAALAMASKLEAQVRAMEAASTNAQMGIGMSRTADAALEGVTSDLQRINELSIQSANGTLNTEDRAAIQEEVSVLKENIQYTLSSAQFNSKALFGGTTENIQAGTDASGIVQIDFPLMNLDTLGISGLDVSTQQGAEAAITSTSDALDKVLTTRTGFGVAENALTSRINQLGEAKLNTMGALSDIQDVNIVEELIKASSVKNKLEAQLMVAAQILKLNGSILGRLFDSIRNSG